MRANDTKHSNRQMSMSFESHFARFKAHQSLPSTPCYMVLVACVRGETEIVYGLCEQMSNRDLRNAIKWWGWWGGGDNEIT